MQNYTDYDAMGLAELVANKDVSAEELLDEALGRAEKARDELNCVSALFPDIAREQIRAGLPEGPLSGVPFMTKDLGIEISAHRFRGHVSDP